MRMNWKCSTHNTQTYTHFYYIENWCLLKRIERIYMCMFFSEAKYCVHLNEVKQKKLNERKKERERKKISTNSKHSRSINFHRKYGNTKTELTACIIVHKLSGLSLWRVPHLPKQWAFIEWWFHLATIFSRPVYWWWWQQQRDVARRALKIQTESHSDKHRFLSLALYLWLL